jgi:hypothetical protein
VLSAMFVGQSSTVRQQCGASSPTKLASSWRSAVSGTALLGSATSARVMDDCNCLSNANLASALLLQRLQGRPGFHCLQVRSAISAQLLWACTAPDEVLLTSRQWLADLDLIAARGSSP